MKKLIIIFLVAAVIVALATSIFFVSCGGERTKGPKQADEIISGSIVNDNGDVLEYIFNNTANTATFILNDEKIEMKGVPMASGIRYENADKYTYIEWQGNVSLTKDGDILFEKTDDLIESSFVDKDGESLSLKVNNFTGAAVVDFNGTIINLKTDTVASGVRYSNEEYVLTDHHGEIQLKKGDTVVFQYDR